MKKGILFSCDMVRAILEGKKTQTLRIAKFSKPVNCWGEETVSKTKPPYAVGDLLYVRETWQEIVCDRGFGIQSYYFYRATDKMGESYQKWSPSIHMPRLAARIWLEVTDVHVERVQDINEKDAMSEGIDMESEFASLCINIETAPYPNDLVRGSAAITVFKKLWESTYGFGSWDANPLVWVIEFKKIEVK